MKYCLALAAWLSLGVAPSLAVTGASINDDAGISAVVRGFEDAWNRHDMDAFAKLFSADADFVNVVGMRWIGRDTIRQRHAASHATMFRASTLRTGDTTIHFLTPDVATARSVWTLSGISAENGEVAPVRTGILTHVLERIDGHWMIVLTQNTDIAKPGP